MQVYEVSFMTTNSSTLVDVHLQVLNGNHLLQANWQFQDEESPIEDYMLAIGDFDVLY